MSSSGQEAGTTATISAATLPPTTIPTPPPVGVGFACEERALGDCKSPKRLEKRCASTIPPAAKAPLTIVMITPFNNTINPAAVTLRNL